MNLISLLASSSDPRLQAGLWWGTLANSCAKAIHSMWSLCFPVYTSLRTKRVLGSAANNGVCVWLYLGLSSTFQRSWEHGGMGGVRWSLLWGPLLALQWPWLTSPSSAPSDVYFRACHCTAAVTCSLPTLPNGEEIKDSPRERGPLRNPMWAPVL